MSADPLDSFNRAQAAKWRADATYRMELRKACDRHGYAAMARRLGVSRQAVRQLVNRGTKGEA